jgi:CelD/BcsL family acetyltransferase involved in cellulose biosynthesis
VRVEVRSVEALSKADAARWRELAARAVEPNPFFEPDFVVPAARRLGTRPGFLLVAEDGGDWAACLPVRREARFRKIPGPARRW